MDDHTSKRTAPLVGGSGPGFCLLPGDLNHQPGRSHCSIGLGGTRATAAKSNSTEDGEQRDSSRVSRHFSISKSMMQKAAPTSPKMGFSSQLSSSKTSKIQQSSIALGRWSSTRNASAGLASLQHSGPTFHRRVDHRPSSNSRLGLSETSNLTASERPTRNFEFLQEAARPSSSRNLLSGNSSAEGTEPGLLSARDLSREQSWNGLDLLNVNNRLLDSVQKKDQHSFCTSMEKNGIINLGGELSTSPMSSVLMNDGESQLINFGTRDPETSFDDSFVDVDPMAEDTFAPSIASSSNLLFHSTVLNQKTQEQISLRRKEADCVDNSPGSSSKAINVSRPLAFKRKSSTTKTACQFTGQSSSQGSSQDILSADYGLLEIYDGRSVETSARIGSPNIGSSGSLSVANALTTTFSSYIGHASEQSCNRVSDLARSTIDGRDSPRVHRLLAEGSVVSNTGGAVFQRSICHGVGLVSHQSSLNMSLPPPLASRRTICATEGNMGFSDGLVGGETDAESELASCGSIRVADQPSVTCNRLQGLNPVSLRGRNSIGTLQRRNDASSGAVNSFGRTGPNRYVRSTDRSMLNSVPSRRLAGSIGPDNRLNRNIDSTSLYSLLLEDEIRNSSVISGVAPLRSSPLQLAAHSSRPQPHSSSSVPLPSVGPTPQALQPLPSLVSAVHTSPLGFFDSLLFGGSTSASDTHERSMAHYSEGVGRRSFHTQSIVSGNQSGFAVNGLAEVLLALERIDQNEVLTYEQMLMLEESLVFAGVGFHDQHSAMRLDIDNMSYEELLALEEQIGNVSTGLSEETISKCLGKALFSSNAAAASDNLDIEVKCSICQEEYEEKDDLGRLECGHSYHEACIKQWLLQKNKCPVCKVSASS